MIMIPIVAGEDFLGLIISGHPTADHFDLNHQNLCQGVAHQAAQAILNSRHRKEEASRSRKGRKFVRF